MTRRRWPLAFAVSTLAEPAPWPKGPMWTDPARKAPPNEPAAMLGGSGEPSVSGSPRPLSWDREDEALAAQPAECPWCPDVDFPDHAGLLRHVIRHARAWEAEALHAEWLRRSLEGQVREFTADVQVMARSILGETS